jgi:predicted transcriptional regulator
MAKRKSRRYTATQLRTLVDRHKGNLNAIARELGLTSQSVRYWLSLHALIPHLVSVRAAMEAAAIEKLRSALRSADGNETKAARAKRTSQSSLNPRVARLGLRGEAAKLRLKAAAAGHAPRRKWPKRGRGAITRILLLIIRALVTGRWTIAELADVIGINYRTAYRYIEELQDAGLVECSREQERGRGFGFSPGHYWIARDNLRIAFGLSSKNR